jgi:Zn-dependent protease
MIGLRLPRPVAVGRIFGIPLLLDWSWMPVIPLYTWAIAAFFLPERVPGRPAAEYWALGLLTTLLLVFSIIVHELAHALVARSEGLAIEDITLYLFGGMARMSDEPKTPRAEFLIAIVGPGASFMLGVLFFGVVTVVLYGTPHAGLGAVLRHLGLVNLVLALFNLLPGFPLDGGRVLRAVIWKRRGDYRAATHTAMAAGRAIAYSLVGVGLYVAVAGRDYGTGLWSMSIGAIVLMLLGLSDRAASREVRRARGTVEAVMRKPPVAVTPETTVHDLINETLPIHRQSSFVVARDGRLHGVVTLADLRDLPRDAWERTEVESCMQPVSDRLFVTARTPLRAAERLLRSNGIGYAAVVDGDGVVVGSLELKDIQ